MRVNAVLSIALILYAGGALAEEAQWQGWYGGVNLGAVYGSSDASSETYRRSGTYPASYFDYTERAPINAKGNGKLHSTGGLAGLELGYNQQLNRWILGGLLSLDASSLSESRSYGAHFIGSTVSAYEWKNRQTVDSDGFVTLRAKVGYTMGQALFFVSGGAALTRLKVGSEYTDNYIYDGRATTSESKLKAGWVLGLGAEYALPDRWSIKAEYLHIDFGKVSTEGGNINLTISGVRTDAYVPDAFRTSANLRMDILRIGLNKAF